MGMNANANTHLSYNELHITFLYCNTVNEWDKYTRKRKLRAEQVKHVINQFNKNYKHIFITVHFIESE